MLRVLLINYFFYRIKENWSQNPLKPGDQKKLKQIVIFCSWKSHFSVHKHTCCNTEAMFPKKSYNPMKHVLETSWSPVKTLLVVLTLLKTVFSCCKYGAHYKTIMQMMFSWKLWGFVCLFFGFLDFGGGLVVFRFWFWFCFFSPEANCVFVRIKYIVPDEDFCLMNIWIPFTYLWFHSSFCTTSKALKSWYTEDVFIGRHSEILHS